MEKSTKIIIGVVGCLCIILFGVTIFANNYGLNGYKDKNGWVHNANSSITYKTDENINNSYALVSMDKTKLTDIDAHTYIEIISPILNGYSSKHYTTIMFEDGTGIYYPGSNIDNIALYGEVNESGIVTQELGQIKVTGTMIAFTEPSVLQSVETKNMYQYLPEKYRSDNGSVVVVDNGLYISVGIGSHEGFEEATVAAEEVLAAFSVVNLSKYDPVKIVVNNEYVFNIVNGELMYQED